MALNFPNSPSDGDTYTYDGITYEWNNSKKRWQKPTGGGGTANAITVADESSDTTCFPVFVTAATGDLGPKSGTNLTFNSSSGMLYATKYNGNFEGNFHGMPPTQSGNRYGVMPYVATDGVMEIGRYIDFHVADNSTADNHGRIQADGGGQTSILVNRDWLPNTGDTYDLGSSGNRWDNLYINDLKLSNKSKKDKGGNDVDGTWGEWTIQEGEEDLFLINNRNGKKYKFNLTEIKE